jgi:hypothetical protein
VGMRLIQIRRGDIRRVALVEEPRLRLLECSSIYELANTAPDYRRDDGRTCSTKGQTGTARL